MEAFEIGLAAFAVVLASAFEVDLACVGLVETAEGEHLVEVFEIGLAAFVADLASAFEVDLASAFEVGPAWEVDPA